MKYLVLIVLASLVGCASMSKQADRIVKDNGSLPKKSLIKDIPLIKQKKNHCGPATLTMAIHHLGKDTSLEEITSQAFTDKGQGTFQTDMLGTARRQGLLTIPIHTMEDLILELSAGHPVIAFQNVGLSWLQQWHYVLVVGHDLQGPDVYLHTGDQSYAKTDMRFFERSWNLGQYWGFVALLPTQLAESANDLAHVEAASNLENLGLIKGAKISYETILKKWPESLPALIGFANTLYTEKNFKRSALVLKEAVKYHPQASVAWHNLAFAQLKQGDQKSAKDSASKAIQYANPEEFEAIKSNLKTFYP